MNIWEEDKTQKSFSYNRNLPKAPESSNGLIGVLGKSDHELMDFNNGERVFLNSFVL
jgi:hypothetical protein